VQAKSICDKYIAPPHTTDFAVMFLPTEGLYAEVIRRPGLVDLLQREHRVVVAGPTTVTALLNSLQMGFRTLAIEQRSSEVWSLLGAVKSEFGKFAGILEKAEKQITTVGRSIGEASRKTRTIERRLRGVESLASEQAQSLLGDLAEADATAEDEARRRRRRRGLSHVTRRLHRRCVCWRPVRGSGTAMRLRLCTSLVLTALLAACSSAPPAANPAAAGRSHQPRSGRGLPRSATSTARPPAAPCSGWAGCSASSA
jgi:hypothetical protein